MMKRMRDKARKREKGLWIDSRSQKVVSWKGDKKQQKMRKK